MPLFGKKSLRAVRFEKRNAFKNLKEHCENIKKKLTDNSINKSLEEAICEMEGVIDTSRALELMINDLASSTSDFFGSRRKIEYTTNLTAIIEKLNREMKVLVGPDLIVLGLEDPVGLPRRQRVIAMKAIFDLLLSFLKIIERHARSAIEHALTAVNGFDDVKENILADLKDLEEDLFLRVEFI
jgi:hypothetical protein